MKNEFGRRNERNRIDRDREKERGDGKTKIVGSGTRVRERDD